MNAKRTLQLAALSAANLVAHASAADIVLTPSAGNGVTITNAAGNANRFRVTEAGVVTLPALGAAPGPTLGLCIQTTSGVVGTCAAAAAVTSISAGTGLAGGTITSTGTLSIAAGGVGANQLADGAITLAKIGANGCSNGQVLKYNGTAWACGTDNTSAGGGVTSISGTSPIGVTPGPTPTISLTGGAAGQVLAGTAGAPEFTGSPTLAGNLTLAASTASTGNIMKGANPFLHSFDLFNIFVGEGAGNFTMAFTNANSALGYFALHSLAGGSHNTATGYEALRDNTNGFDNTASGSLALRSNTEGAWNTAAGRRALTSNTTGTGNTGVGSDAMGLNTTGSYNTAVGTRALLFSVSGDYSTAVGYSALEHGLGANNVALGAQALYATTSGFENAAVGRSAGESNTSGAGNTSVGYRALFSNTDAFNSTAVGAQALANSTGMNNTALGAFAGASVTTGINNIMIANGGDSADTATTRIGAAQSRAFIAGIRGITTGQANAIQVFIDSSGQLGTASSSRSVKEDIADMGAASDVLMKLRPVTFHYKSHVASGQDALQYGLIAEEVAEVAPELAARSADGRIETVNYQFLAPMLVNEVQKQRQVIAGQAARIDALEAELAAIRRALGLR